jgi:signal recognition particle subunit SRP54
MTGQDAVSTAKSFNSRLELDGVILTKFDSDTRGGAALSVKHVTGKPIKFIGVGEKLDALEEFHPERIAGRILNMGDMVTLVEKAQENFDAESAAKAQEKMARGDFGFDDFLTQMESFKKLGSIKSIMKMIPGLGSALGQIDIPDDELDRYRGIIHSMTAKERRNPDVIEASRRRRIARGAGVAPDEVSALVKNFLRMKPMMKMMSGAGLGQKMQLMKGLSDMGALQSGQMPKMKGSTATSARFDPRKRDKKKRRRR